MIAELQSFGDFMIGGIVGMLIIAIIIMVVGMVDDD